MSSRLSYTLFVVTSSNSFIPARLLISHIFHIQTKTSSKCFRQVREKNYQCLYNILSWRTLSKSYAGWQRIGTRSSLTQALSKENEMDETSRQYHKEYTELQSEVSKHKIPNFEYLHFSLLRHTLRREVAPDEILSREDCLAIMNSKLSQVVLKRLRQEDNPRRMRISHKLKSEDIDMMVVPRVKETEETFSDYSHPQREAIMPVVVAIAKSKTNDESNYGSRSIEASISIVTSIDADNCENESKYDHEVIQVYDADSKLLGTSPISNYSVVNFSSSPRLASDVC